ncbi:hypothetical protein GE061_018692 [Apolygus lucorum]|uniref:rhomboid protease n=1 Tax=Apolygus lucorum TaxID=248454 RepID=A0A8S9XFW5_APOLU|nr:hypothetical protein GE061_018692 [Apolygus lucorum]
MALSRTLLSSGQYWRNGILSQPPQIPKCREFYKSSLMCCRGSGGGGGRSLRPPNTVPDTLASRVESIKLETRPLNSSCLIRPAIFTVAFSTTSLACATIWQYENLRAKRLVHNTVEWFNNRAYKYGHWRNEANNWWNSLSEGQKVFYPICFLNALVFLAWKVPSFQTTMARYFFSNPVAKNNCWPMVLSAFSHYSALHIFANMYVLHSFSTGAVLMMGKEQFVGFYMAAAAVSSLASYACKVALSKPGFSLGASGAIMAVLAYTCVKNPDSLLNIIFLPMITFKAGMALKAVMAFDAAGVVLGWTIFDHAAHLGGALFGVFWAHYGYSYMHFQRQHIFPLWHQLRSKNN